MSGFVVVNLPISFLLVMARPTIINILGAQWINQTYNAAMNYANRNASSLYTTSDVLQSYITAVLLAGAISLGG